MVYEWNICVNKCRICLFIILFSAIWNRSLEAILKYKIYHLGFTVWENRNHQSNHVLISASCWSYYLLQSLKHRLKKLLYLKPIFFTPIRTVTETQINIFCLWKFSVASVQNTVAWSLCEMVPVPLAPSFPIPPRILNILAVLNSLKFPECTILFLYRKTHLIYIALPAQNTHHTFLSSQQLIVFQNNNMT